MDYRQLEYHLKYRSPELIREREHDRLIETALAQHSRRSPFVWIGLVSARLLQRGARQASPATMPVVTPTLTEQYPTGC